MKFRFKILFLMLSTVFCAKGQVDTTLNFDSLGKKITLFQKEWGEQQSLIIKDIEDNLIQKYKLNKEEIDPYRIAESYNGKRNFIVIGGRYEFYILIIKTNHLIGPYRCCCRYEAQDAQTGVLRAFDIIANGQYLLVGSLDNGPYCFNLADLYNPEKVNYITLQKQPYQTAYLFLDKRKENIYNGIFASYKNYSNTIHSKYLIQAYRFEQTPDGALKKKIGPDGFLLLNQLDPDGEISELKIKLENGEIVKD